MSRRPALLVPVVAFIGLSSCQRAATQPAVPLAAASRQQDSGWRISPEGINIQAGEDRALQLLDDSAQELHGATWSLDDPTLADIRDENGRTVVHAKVAGTLTVTAILRGEKRIREIKIWPSRESMPQRATGWGTHPIGRELGDISAVPTPDGPHIFSLEQTASGDTYLRGVGEDGIQLWAWLMPEQARDVELVCGDWMGGALISANRGDSYTLYAVGQDGKLRWQHKLAGIRKGHAYNLNHLVNILSQSLDGTVTTLTGFDQMTGAQKFEHTLPTSHQRLTNLRNGARTLTCASQPITSAVRTAVSRLFVNIDGFAYVAFSLTEQTLASRGCTAGSTIAPRDVTSVLDARVVLWQIHSDGTYRSTVVEGSTGSRPLSEPATVASPTGAIIPDGLGGVLLSVRRSPNAVEEVPRSGDEFVYRLDQDGKVLYALPLPKYDGRLHDEMVLGENNRGFVSRGGTLIAFNLPEGKEIWRWDSHTPEIEVFAALAGGACAVQTPTALVAVKSATDVTELVKGQAMVDWQGQIFRKHN